MAQGRVVQTPKLAPRISDIRPVQPLIPREVGLDKPAPTEQYDPTASMFAMPPEGDPTRLNVSPSPMDFMLSGGDSNVRNFSGGDGSLPPGILSPEQYRAEYEKGLAGIHQAQLREYTDLSKLPMEQMMPVPEPTAYSDTDSALAASGIMGLLGGGFGARAGAHAAGKFAASADAVRQERSARDMARNQLQNELVQQRNQMKLKTGDLQNDDVARHNAEQLRRESTERDLLEKRFKVDSDAYMRSIQEETRRQIADDRRVAKAKDQAQDAEKLKQQTATAKARQIYQYIKAYLDKTGTMSKDDLAGLQKWTRSAMDPELQSMVPFLSDITAEAKKKLALQGETVSLKRQSLAATERYHNGLLQNQRDRIKSMEGIATNNRTLREKIAGVASGKNSSSQTLKQFSVRNTFTQNKIKQAKDFMNQALRLSYDASQLRKMPGGVGLDAGYIDPHDPRLNDLSESTRGTAAAKYLQSDHLNEEARRLFAEAAQEQAQIAEEFRQWQLTNGGGTPPPVAPPAHQRLRGGTTTDPKTGTKYIDIPMKKPGGSPPPTTLDGAIKHLKDSG